MSIRRAIRTLALAGVMGATAACSDILSDDEATIIVENNASVSVWYMYISPCEDDTWGSDELGRSETIDPGEERSFDVEAGCYDLLAEFSDESTASDLGIHIDEGDEFTWTLVD